MTKRFYVVVPYDPVSDKQKSWRNRFTEVFSAASDLKLNQEQFLKRRRALSQRVEHILSYLASMSLKAVVLDTQSLIELYYNTYNPGLYKREKLVEVNKIQVE